MAMDNFLFFIVQFILLFCRVHAFSLATSFDNSGCHGGKLDLVFVLDSSGSVGFRNFARTKDFTRNVISSMNVSADGIRVAVVQFATKAQVISHFNEHMNKTDKMAVVQDMVFRPGSTYTDRALETVQKSVIVPEHGDRYDVSDFIILMTDGASVKPNRTINFAESLKQRPSLTIMVIGIGASVNNKEMSGIASDPSLVFRVVFANLWQVVKNVSQLTCPEPIEATQLASQSNGLTSTPTPIIRQYGENTTSTVLSRNVTSTTITTALKTNATQSPPTFSSTISPSTSSFANQTKQTSNQTSYLITEGTNAINGTLSSGNHTTPEATLTPSTTKQHRNAPIQRASLVKQASHTTNETSSPGAKKPHVAHESSSAPKRTTHEAKHTTRKFKHETREFRHTTHRTNLTSHEAKQTTSGTRHKAHETKNTTQNAQPTTHEARHTTPETKVTTHEEKNTTHEAKNSIQNKDAQHEAKYTTHKAEHTSHQAEHARQKAENTTHKAEPTTHEAEQITNEAKHTTAEAKHTTQGADHTTNETKQMTSKTNRTSHHTTKKSHEADHTTSTTNDKTPESDYTPSAATKKTRKADHTPTIVKAKTYKSKETTPKASETSMTEESTHTTKHGMHAHIKTPVYATNTSEIANETSSSAKMIKHGSNANVTLGNESKLTAPARVTPTSSENLTTSAAMTTKIRSFSTTAMIPTTSIRNPLIRLSSTQFQFSTQGVENPTLAPLLSSASANSVQTRKSDDGYDSSSIFSLESTSATSELSSSPVNFHQKSTTTDESHGSTSIFSPESTSAKSTFSSSATVFDQKSTTISSATDAGSSTPQASVTSNIIPFKEERLQETKKNSSNTLGENRFHKASSSHRGDNKNEKDFQTMGVAVGLGLLGVLLLLAITACLVLALRRRKSDDDEEQPKKISPNEIGY